jgi:hypothetical protein
MNAVSFGIKSKSILDNMLLENAESSRKKAIVVIVSKTYRSAIKA